MKKVIICLLVFFLPLLTFSQEAVTTLGIDQQIDEAFKPFSDFVSSCTFPHATFLWSFCDTPCLFKFDVILVIFRCKSVYLPANYW